MDRRTFLRSLAAVGVTAAGGRALSFAAAPATGPASQPLRVGLISDLHHNSFGKDEVARLRAFIDRAVATPTDFILQNGDFCYPQGAPAAMAEWNRFTGDKFHVLGNHDMDGCDKPTIMKLWGMPAPYYSFDRGGFHFVVLDRNNFIKGKSILPYAKGNWGKVPGAATNCCDKEQLAWLAADLARADKPTVVFMHQPLVATNNPALIGNGAEILDIFDAANFDARKRAGSPRVVAAFLGHDHDDLYAERNSVHYVMVNSASYVYAPPHGAVYYRDPLFAFVTFDAAAGRITIEGRGSPYASATTPDAVRMRFVPRISDRTLATT